MKNISSGLEGPIDLVCSFTLYCFLIKGDYDSQRNVMSLITSLVFKVSLEYAGGGDGVKISLK